VRYHRCLYFRLKTKICVGSDWLCSNFNSWSLYLDPWSLSLESKICVGFDWLCSNFNSWSLYLDSWSLSLESKICVGSDWLCSDFNSGSLYLDPWSLSLESNIRDDWICMNLDFWCFYFHLWRRIFSNFNFWSLSINFDLWRCKRESSMMILSFTTVHAHIN